MTCTTRCYPHDNTIVPGKHLDISVAHEFCDQLDTVDAEYDVIVEGSHVIDLDASIHRLLVALAIQVRDNERRIHWVSPSKSLLITEHRSGLAAQPGLETP